MEILQEKNSRAGVIGTILFHLLLLLLFIQFGMTYQDPPEENAGGMVINFGTSDEGMGDVQPSSSETTTTSENATQSETTTPSSAQENALTTTEESVEMNASQNTTTTNQNTTTQQTEQTVDENLSNALNALNNPNNNSTNDGNTGTPGDQGDESGDPNSSNYTGGGTVNGVGVHFEGGTLTDIKKPKNPTDEDATVVVNIVVNNKGDVSRAKVDLRNTTTTNKELQDISIKAAKKATFKMKGNAPPEQSGTITFIYRHK